jgi:hypothetical protein
MIVYSALLIKLFFQLSLFLLNYLCPLDLLEISKNKNTKTQAIEAVSKS